jgi:threonine dehydrogenase-like Zn-dependent dehydrogenase
MKAIVQDRYGSPDVLTLRDVDKPAPADNELLVRVHAASVNARDWHLMRGDPYVARPSFGFDRPKVKIRGTDFAGRVETVGSDVQGPCPGDEVFGEADGAFAEYVCAPDGVVEAKPANLTFEQAAAVPLAGNTALIGLRDVARVEPAQHVLINGASGGVGTFAVQIAKSFGAEVTGSLTDFRRALTPTGTLVLSGGGVSRGGSMFGPMGLFLSKENLAALRELAESGKLTPVIDRTYREPSSGRAAQCPARPASATRPRPSRRRSWSAIRSAPGPRRRSS